MDDETPELRGIIEGLVAVNHNLVAAAILQTVIAILLGLILWRVW